MTAAEYLPGDRSLASLEAAASRCNGCTLYKSATQTVFGHGHPDAPIMLVGEQPGDREDIEGLPFVGPAGGLLARALDGAGIDPDLTYQTNAVKHSSSRAKTANGEYTRNPAVRKWSRAGPG